MSKGKAHDRAVGVDIGSTSIKLLKLSKNNDGGFSIDDIKDEPLVEGVVVDKNIVEPDKLIERFRAVVPKFGRLPVSFCVPTVVSSSSFIEDSSRTFDTDREMGKYIMLNADSLIVGKIAEVSYDYERYKIAPDNVSKKKRLGRVVSAKSESVAQRAKILEVVGFTPKLATVESIAIENILPYVAEDKMGGDFVVVDVGYNMISFYFVVKGLIMFSETNQYGSANLTRNIAQGENINELEAEREKERWLESGLDVFIDTYLADYINGIRERSQSFIKRLESIYSDHKFASDMPIVYLGGGVGFIQRSPRAVSNLLGSSGDSFAKLSSKVQINPNIADDFNKDQTSYFVALGLALGQFKQCINLMPWREEKYQENRKQYLSGAVLAALVGALVSFGWWTFQNNVLSKHVAANAAIASATAAIKTDLEKLKEITVLRDSMLERMRLIDDLEAQRPTFVAIHTASVRSVPDDAYLLEYARSDMDYEFKGRAKNPQVVADFMRRLKSTPWFDDIFMSSFVVDSEKDPSGELIAAADGYGTFVVTAKLRGLTFESVMAQSPDIDKASLDASLQRSISQAESQSASSGSSGSGFAAEPPAQVNGGATSTHTADGVTPPAQNQIQTSDGGQVPLAASSSNVSGG